MAGDMRLLVVDDDMVLIETVRRFFQQREYLVDVAMNNAGFVDCLRGGCVYDLILLDLNLPDSDGLDILAGFRENYGNLLYIVSGRRDTLSRVRALELGADDFIQKPFSLRELELKARNAVIRYRKQSVAQASEDSGSHDSGAWSLNNHTRAICFQDGDELPLTNGEFKLLEAFIKSGGRTISREQLLAYLPPSAHITSAESITTLVYRLRQKFRAYGAESFIKTVPGEGYRLLL